MKTNIKPGLLLIWHGIVLVLALNSAGLAQAGLYDDWSQRIRITFPTPLNGPLTNFPVLISFSNNMDGCGFAYSDFLATGGGDLRFADSNETTALDYEIENWDTNGTSAVWVKLPLLQSTNDYIYAYWGKATNAPPCTTNGAVWDTNTLGVWHFSDAPSASAGDIRNSVSNSVQAKSANMEAGDLVTGLAGGALDFDGANECVSNVLSGTALSEFTISFWERSDTTPATQKGIFQWAQQLSSGTPFLLLIRGNTTPRSIMSYYRDAVYASVEDLPDAAWIYVTLTLSPGAASAKIYQTWVNGVPVTSYTDGDGTASTQPNAAAVYFANGYNGYFDGQMDEARVASVARSTNWIYATWLNMVSNDSFCACVYAPMGGAGILTSTPSNVTTNTATLRGTLTHTNAGPTTVFAYWGLSDGGTNGPWDNTIQFDGYPALGTVSTNVTLPTPNRYYYYRYAASNAAGLFWANSTVFFMAGEVTVAATDATAVPPDNTGTFTLSRPATATNEALIVTYATSGSATHGADYTLSSALFSAGATNAIMTLTALADNDTSSESATMTILPGATYGLAAASNATVTIRPAPLVKLVGTMFSTPGNGTPDSNAFDGNTNTYFEANNGAAVPSGGYVGLDLGAGGAKRVTTVRFHPRIASRMNGGKFQGSNDATNGVYTDLYTIPETPPLAWSEASVSNITAYRYLRYYGADGQYCNIAELEFWVDTTPHIDTVAATDVTLAIATLNGNLTAIGGSPTTVFAYWGLMDGGTNGPWDYTTQLNGEPAIGAVSTNVSLPTPNRYYYYRHAASNDAGIFWATSSVSFMAGEVTVTATDTNAALPGDTGTFTLTRPASATNEALTVSYAMSGTAINTMDYTNSASVATFAAGATSTVITLTPLADTDTASEDAVLTILPGNYFVGVPSNATVTIQGASSIAYFIANNANWNVAGNWSGGVVPGAGQIGIIGGSDGSVTTAYANAILAGPPSAIIIKSNGALRVRSAGLTEQNLILDGGRIYGYGLGENSTVTLASEGTFSSDGGHINWYGLIQGPGRLVVSNTGAYMMLLVHSGGNTYSGGTEVRKGVFNAGYASSSQPDFAGTGDIEIFPEGIFSLGNSVVMSSSRVILSGGKITSAANYALAAPILVKANSACLSSGAAALFLTGSIRDFDDTHSGVLAVSCSPYAQIGGNNSEFSGGFRVTGYQLNCAAANSLGSGPVEVEDGLVVLSAAGAAMTNDVTLHTAGTLSIGVTAPILGKLAGTGSHTYTVNSSRATWLRGVSPGTNTTTMGTFTVNGGTETGCRLMLGTNSTNTFHLRAPGDQDQVVFTNNPVNLTLNGVLKIDKIDTLADGNYTLFDLNGGIISNAFSSIVWPENFKGSISTNSGDVVLSVQFTARGTVLLVY